MGHLVGKDIYNQLAKKIDGLTARTPNTKAFYSILKTLYSPKEALLIVNMPFGLSSAKRIARCAKLKADEVQKTLDQLCHKGLVIDLCLKDRQYYMPSPLVIGIFEFTLMRQDLDDKKTKEIATLFHDYLLGSQDFFSANLSKKQKTALARTLPHIESVENKVEVLDYEKAKNIVENAKAISLGICSCRHEKTHLNLKKCDVSLDTCTSFDVAAQYLIRNDLAKEISKEQMLEILDYSREKGLVFNADNVQNKPSFICHCCSCCCNMLQGMKKFGYTNAVVSSNYLPKIDKTKCKNCLKCVSKCPVEAINKETLEIDEKICLGCGVCALECPTGAIKLISKKQRTIYPKDTFERIILTTLEQGTLQNQLFDDPHKITHAFMRGFLGAVLQLSPVKKALLSQTLRSHFLSAMKKGAGLQNKNDFINL